MSIATGGNLADSEGDNGDVELEDEDSVGDDRYHSASHNLSSFKRAGPTVPARSQERQSGGRSRSRGGEGDKPRRSKGDKDKHGRVGQLDERNLKRAANRYGTLPKGARIGAYLESMRVSGLTPEPGSDDTDTLDSHKSGATDPGSRSSGVVADVMSSTAAMARSNSSHGGFPGGNNNVSRQHHLPRRVPTYTQSQPGHLPPQSPRIKPANALHDLDFPPPPPPPETERQSRNTSVRGRKSRDHSSDSCEESIKSYSDTASMRLNCVSPVVSSLPPDPTPASHQQQLFQEILKAGEMRSETPPLPASSPLPSQPPTSDPASQLVTELFESIKLKSDDKQNASKPPKGANSVNKNEIETKPVDFKAGLRKVNQHPLSHEKQEASNSQINFKSQLKKTNSSLYAQPTNQNMGNKDEEPESEPGRVDFKSQLKKVKSSKPSNSSEQTAEAQETGKDFHNFKASLKSVSKQNIDFEEEYEEDKRKSTGSISSLKKMWEEGGDGVKDPSDDRPGSVVKFEKRVWPPVPSTETEKPMVPVKPTVKPPPTSKPPPPREPSCKPPPKPSTTTKPLVCNIYAAPTSMPPSAPKPNISAIKPKLPITSKPSSSTDHQDNAQPPTKTRNGTGEARADSTDSGLSSTNDKDNLIDLSVSLENLLDSLAKDGITKATAMSASDKVHFTFYIYLHKIICKS